MSELWLVFELRCSITVQLCVDRKRSTIYGAAPFVTLNIRRRHAARQPPSPNFASRRLWCASSFCEGELFQD